MEEEIVKERIRENEGLFSEKELEFIEKNDAVIKKVYILGAIDGYILRNI